MFDIDTIIEKTKNMGISVEDSNSNHHYILNNKGEKMEFELDMIYEYFEEETYRGEEWIRCSIESVYDSYELDSMYINKSIIGAA